MSPHSQCGRQLRLGNIPQPAILSYAGPTLRSAPGVEYAARCMKGFPAMRKGLTSFFGAAVLLMAATQMGCGNDGAGAAARAESEQELQRLRETNQELQRLRA